MNTIVKNDLTMLSYCSKLMPEMCGAPLCCRRRESGLTPVCVCFLSLFLLYMFDCQAHIGTRAICNNIYLWFFTQSFFFLRPSPRKNARLWPYAPLLLRLSSLSVWHVTTKYGAVCCSVLQCAGVTRASDPKSCAWVPAFCLVNALSRVAYLFTNTSPPTHSHTRPHTHKDVLLSEFLFRRLAYYSGTTKLLSTYSIIQVGRHEHCHGAYAFPLGKTLGASLSLGVTRDLNVCCCVLQYGAVCCSVQTLGAS